VQGILNYPDSDQMMYSGDFNSLGQPSKGKKYSYEGIVENIGMCIDIDWADSDSE